MLRYFSLFVNAYNSTIKEVVGGEMPKTIRARFSSGVFKPLEKIEFPENKELEITIADVTT